MKTHICFLSGVFFCIAFLACLCDGSEKANISFSEKNKETGVQTNNVSTVKAGRIAYIDPKTGKLTSKPSGNIKIEQSKKTSSKTEELKEVKSSVEGGGYVVDLKGRFRQSIVVENKNGKLIKKCSNEGAGGKKSENCEHVSSNLKK